MPADYEDLRDTFYAFAGSDAEGFDAYYEVYIGSTASQDDPDADDEMFYQFLNAFVPDVEPQSKEYWDNIRQAFYELSGITYENIDWEMWRIAIGYGRE